MKSERLLPPSLKWEWTFHKRGDQKKSHLVNTTESSRDPADRQQLDCSDVWVKTRPTKTAALKHPQLNKKHCACAYCVAFYAASRWACFSCFLLDSFSSLFLHNSTCLDACACGASSNGWYCKSTLRPGTEVATCVGHGISCNYILETQIKGEPNGKNGYICKWL